MVTKQELRRRATKLGADLFGVAPVERFADAPAGFHPRDIMKGCQSVIVMAARFPSSTMAAGTQSAYTFVRHRMVDKLDRITFTLAAELEEKGIAAMPIPSSEPYDYWDAERQHGRGILSLKHAAVRAGLGKMGKNTLLVNDTYGNMVWLGAVLVDLAMDPDRMADYEACIPGCRICLEACPAGALDGTTIVQKKCRSVSGRATDGGGFVLACNTCRKVCPRRQGLA